MSSSSKSKLRQSPNEAEGNASVPHSLLSAADSIPHLCSTSQGGESLRFDAPSSDFGNTLKESSGSDRARGDFFNTLSNSSNSGSNDFCMNGRPDHHEPSNSKKTERPIRTSAKNSSLAKIDNASQSWDAAGGTRAAGATPGRVVSWTRTCRE
jgi:hypothetical protein